MTPTQRSYLVLLEFRLFNVGYGLTEQRSLSRISVRFDELAVGHGQDFFSSSEYSEQEWSGGHGRERWGREIANVGLFLLGTLFLVLFLLAALP